MAALAAVIGAGGAAAPRLGPERRGRAAGAAGKARYTKKEVEVLGVPQTQLTKPAGPAKDTKKPTGPMLTVEEFRGVRQEKIQSSTRSRSRSTSACCA